jgi:hypothetical protein
MRIGRLVATLGVAVVATLFVSAAPAYAADSNVRIKSRGAGNCASSTSSSAMAARASCTSTTTRWHYQPRGTSPSGHTLAKLQSIYDGGCLDTLGRGWGGVVYTHSCNTGNNQLWEIFPVSSGGKTYYVFKSWGAYKGLNQHLCLYAWSSPTSEDLEKCDTADSFQQWTKTSA